VWCDEGMYPRKLFMEMKGGRAVWRCACFKEMGWSDVRKVGDLCTSLLHLQAICGAKAVEIYSPVMPGTN
jgi:hypothetical protein